MNKKVLIIEDETQLCEFLELRFLKEGFEVILAHNGLKGWEKTKAENPDLVILDLMLPELSGEEVCRKIRKDPLTEKIPIIMLTAKGTDADKVVGKVLGADAYMVKPFEGAELIAEVRKLMKKKDIPTGETTQDLKARLFKLLEKEALKKGKFVLSSGKTSNYYLDGRVITLTPEGAYLVGSIILNSIKGEDIHAVGGPTLGADPITGAIAVLGHINKIPFKTFIVRKAVKEHGTQRQVEGPELKKGDRVILVDDVATTGKALIEAKTALDNLGIEVVRAMVIVDRCEGARENLSKVGLELDSIFTIKDFGL